MQHDRRALGPARAISATTSLHLLLMPSLLACAFLSNASVPRADLQRLARRVYPYVADEYFLRWTRGRTCRPSWTSCSRTC
ncbi:MAG: hypothetical protein MZW92_07845 [Comamonadaceae bacterium]|nr:hypothetical protein [Comamonadaceae bacterium]